MVIMHAFVEQKSFKNVFRELYQNAKDFGSVKIRPDDLSGLILAQTGCRLSRQRINNENLKVANRFF